MVTTVYDRDILLAGIPRSGTTLVCKLLSGLPNTVALVEPMRMSSLRALGREVAIDRIGDYLRETRTQLAGRGAAASRLFLGAIPENMFEAAAASGLRRNVTVRAEHEFPGLKSGFLLLVKHPAGFTGLMDLLHRRYSCFAMIRNPLAMLASWNTVDAPFENGHSPAAEYFDAGLRSALAGIADKLERQIHLLSWYFETYERWLAPGRILRYEDVVASPGRALSVLTPPAQSLRAPLHSRDANSLYHSLPIRELGEALLKRQGAYWNFYSRESVRELMDRIQTESRLASVS
jgi:hypothetical protein